MRVLIVEQDENIGNVLSTYLDSEGVENRWTNSFNPYVIIDFLPTHVLLAHSVFNTKEVQEDADILRKLCSIKILLLSTAESEVTSKEFPHHAVIKKPFNIDELCQLLQLQ